MSASEPGGGGVSPLTTRYSLPGERWPAGPEGALAVADADAVAVTAPGFAGDLDGYVNAHADERTPVGIALLILLIAIIVGGVSLLVEALEWLLIIALILLLIGLFTGWRARQRLTD